MSQLINKNSNEFKEGQNILSEPASRRQFIKGLGATMAVAGLTSCGSIRKPEQVIRPYAVKPEKFVEGKATFYASAINSGSNVEGILVETYEGRPTKIEGNPDHPNSLGATSLRTQGEIYNLYDPDRLQNPQKNGSNKTIKEFKNYITGLKLNSNSKVGILIDRIPSPSFHELLSTVKSTYPSSIIAEHSPYNANNTESGTKLLSGQSLTPNYYFDKAQTVLSVGSDFLNGNKYGSSFSKGFSKRRDVESNKKLNRLYVVEDTYTNTGGSADHRIKLSNQYFDAFLILVTNKLIEEQPSKAKMFFTQSYIRSVKLLSKQYQQIVDTVYLDAVVDDLINSEKESIIIIGDEQPSHVHAMGSLLNLLLGNINNTVTYHTRVVRDYRNNLNTLLNAIDNNQIDTLVILSYNPSFTLSSQNFSEKLKKVPNTIYLASISDKTSNEAVWTIPRSHNFESWGDLITPFGTHSITQPTINPMYNSLTEIDILLALINDNRTTHEFVKSTTLRNRSKRTWDRWLHTGIIQTTNNKITKPFSTSKLASKLVDLVENKTELIAIFDTDSSIYDGRFINNAWLQEIPDTITKVVWDTTALISPSTALKYGIKTGQIITVSSEDKSIETVVKILPGKPDNSISLFKGYGQKQAGKLGSNRGFDVYEIASPTTSTISVSIKAGTDYYELVQTQEEDTQHGRPLYRETDVKTYDKKPDVIKNMVEHPKLESLWEEHKFDESYSPYQWGMTVDLNKCSGCNACAVACQSENNIPTVGKTEVKNGREMHWLRMDRYFEGDSENPEMKTQPMMCVHCELAPCEQVCPVAATVHDEEGLNVMVYNRCIGTRYCANNCPYKVRKFNFYDWAQRSPHGVKKERNHLFDYFKTSPKSLQMQKNPDVTVRMRGVMEKCTYCLQRIKDGKHRASNEDRMVKDGEIKTACQQVCSSDAIVFGNILDKESAVFKTRETKRAYAVLQELNTKPRTLYLARIKNPHPLISKKFNHAEKTH